MMTTTFTGDAYDTVIHPLQDRPQAMSGIGNAINTGLPFAPPGGSNSKYGGFTRT